MTTRNREGSLGPSRREDLLREDEPHPSPEMILGLLEDECPAANDAEIRAHLASCRRCFGLYAEAMRVELEWRHGDGRDAAPRELLEATMALAPVSVSLRKSVSSHARRRRLGPAWATAAAVVVVAVTVAAVSGPLGEVARNRHLLEPVRTAMSEVSRAGMILTPDVAASAASLRGPGTADRRALSRALDELARRYDQAPTEAAAYWLAAGMLAEEDPGAHAILSEAMRRHPGSRRLANLAAILDYRSQRLAAADDRLARILSRHPRDPVALFNRALVLKQQGRTEALAEVAVHLARVAPPGTPLGHRIRSEILPSTSR